jgi:hypothetical protein
LRAFQNFASSSCGVGIDGSSMFYCELRRQRWSSPGGGDTGPALRPLKKSSFSGVPSWNSSPGF